MRTDTPRTDDYYAGKGCQCHAHDQSECGCDADWTDERIYKLQAEVERLHNYIKRVLLFLDSDLPTKETAKFWDEYESQYGKIQ